jgi:hypothetical protein
MKPEGLMLLKNFISIITIRPYEQDTAEKTRNDVVS